MNKMFQIIMNTIKKDTRDFREQVRDAILKAKQDMKDEMLSYCEEEKKKLELELRKDFDFTLAMKDAEIVSLWNVISEMQEEKKKIQRQYQDYYENMCELKIITAECAENVKKSLHTNGEIFRRFESTKIKTEEYFGKMVEKDPHVRSILGLPGKIK